MNEGTAPNLQSNMSEPSFIHLAEAHRREGLVEDAIRICREGLAKLPTSLRGRIVLGQCLLDQGAIGEAIVELGRVERESGGDPAILALLCEVRVAEPQRRPVRADVAAEDGVSGQMPDGELAADEAIEPPVLILDGAGEAASEGASAESSDTDPLASPTLAGLYASQGDHAMAETILRRIAPNETPPAEEAPPQTEPGSVAYLAELSRLREVAERLRKIHPR
jgi:hypothetical protein